ncbi:MAG TPA: hypothetical protein PK156_45920 [Polyangium sp.]|nr:hypothetical protein [Polyangium sp.]
MAKIGLLVLAVISSVTFAARAASPNEHPWRLLFTRATSAPDNCPDEQYLRKSLAGKLDGHTPFTNDALRSISVDIKAGDSDVEAHVVTRDENGDTTTNQTLHADAWRCDLLGERVVFVLQDIVAPIESQSVATQAAPNPSPAAPKNTALPGKDKPPVPAPIEKNPSKHNPSKKAPTFGLSLGLGPAWWNAPETALSTSFGIEARWRRIAIGIEGQYDHAWAIPNVHDAQAERAGAALVGCILHPLSVKFFVRGCGFVDVARLSGQSDKIQTPTQHAPVVDIGARMGLGILMFRSFAVELRADGAYVAHRPVFDIDGNQVWHVAPFTGALRVAIVGEIDVL